MISATILVAASAMATTATASPIERNFQLDGEPVAYVETIGADGTRHIQGERRSDNQQFRFVVRPDGRVSGRVGDTSVSFRINRNR